MLLEEKESLSITSTNNYENPSEFALEKHLEDFPESSINWNYMTELSDDYDILKMESLPDNNMILTRVQLMFSQSARIKKNYWSLN